ncbi:DUF29 domain-containing protein [Synechococcus sp. PCC 6312]|uniref:DUF29 domain-containing protein n=1 Tax=Synechococcus sp. (strain ATCC 27167 / PCC 6312) TaxID=195253 RepID=UPI00029EDF44|nr:DUF29 domain-containing protein [Synechococcus sp. PCC 6312]AFY60038.1 protein of unknown function DUF29 [Synechococcus sp. PCC 6312]
MTPTDVALNLYGQDLDLWYQETATTLQKRDFRHLDVDHLIEEILSLSNRNRREVLSRLDVLLSHLLKRLYVPSTPDYRGWENTIREQQKQLRRIFQDSPSLKGYARQIFDQAWSDAIVDVKANYPDVELPQAWTLTETIDELISPELCLKLSP